MFGALDISTSGLIAQRINMDTIATNVSNFQTIRRPDGQAGPYMRKVALFTAGDGRGGAGVHVSNVVEDTQSQVRLVKDPGHPDANAEGFVAYPNVNLSTEMINMMVAARAYEANVTAAEATKSIISSTLRLIA